MIPWPFSVLYRRLDGIQAQLVAIREELRQMSETERAARADLDSIAASEDAIAAGIGALQKATADQAATILQLSAQLADGQPVTAQDLADLHTGAQRAAAIAAGLAPSS